jgi:hypothetical protein
MCSPILILRYAGTAADVPGEFGPCVWRNWLLNRFFFLSAHSAALLEFQRLWSIFPPPPKKHTHTQSGGYSVLVFRRDS